MLPVCGMVVEQVWYVCLALAPNLTYFSAPLCYGYLFLTVYSQTNFQRVVNPLCGETIIEWQAQLDLRKQTVGYTRNVRYTT